MTILTSTPFNITIIGSGSSSLSGDAAELSAGESIQSISLPSDIQRFDISWQNRTAFYDAVHEEIQFMGKPAGSVGGTARSPHWIYTEATDTWRLVKGVVAPGKLGHVWQVTFDHWDDPGDYFFVEQDVLGNGTDLDKTCRWYDHSADSWGLIEPQASFEVWEPTDTPNPALCYHPNLLGPGIPGIFCWSTVGFSVWNKNTGAWTHVRFVGLSAPYGDRNHNTSLYIPGWDRIICGSSRNMSLQCLILEAGSGGSIATDSPAMENVPIRVQSDNNFNSAHMLIDPRSDDTVMLLERGGTRVWTNSQGGDGNSWNLQSWGHPFWDNLPRDPQDAGSWTPCSIPRYGVVLGMATFNSFQNDGANGTIMWRPG